jgi:formylglycine-generating enzyme
MAPHLGWSVACLTAAAALTASACSSKSQGPDGASPDQVTADLPEVGGIHGSCPTTLAGPVMARVSWNGGPAYCIDSTEVTNAQYQAFLTTVAPPAPNLRCAWNTSLAPAATGAGCTAFDPVGRPDLPVVCVDWCDADAYCRGVGKYLCGVADPDGVHGGRVTNPTSKTEGSQWIVACSNDGTLTYPYGNEGTSGRCADKKFPSTTPGVQPVKSAATCEGGVPGLFDMAGNASEWQNNCVEAAASADGQDDACDTYGGARSSEYPDTSCLAATSPTDTTAHFKRAQVAPDNGFRCCVNAVF